MSFTDAAASVIERTRVLAEIPAPPLDERDRAAVVASWWSEDRLEADIDEAGNVRAMLRDGRGPATVVCAHLDTVFARSVDHAAKVDGSTMRGPGVGDDTVGVAALSALARLLPAQTTAPVWIVATTGEEGLGNLAGAHHLMTSPPGPLGAVIAVEGNYLGRIATTGVGSVRWRVGLSGPGGHAWEAAGSPSAIHEMAALITGLDDVVKEAARRARSSVNIGSVAGGETINARARNAEMTVDLRSEDPDALTDIESGASALLDAVHGEITVEIDELGRRPAGSVKGDHALVAAGDAGLRDIGRAPDHTAASTDANAAYAAGVPAITIGITTGGGEHTLDEWIDLEPIPDGLRALVSTIVNYHGGRE